MGKKVCYMLLEIEIKLKNVSTGLFSKLHISEDDGEKKKFKMPLFVSRKFLSLF